MAVRSVMNRSVFRYGGSSEGVLVLVYVPGIAPLPHHIFVLSNPTTQPTRRSVKYGNSRFWLRIHPKNRLVVRTDIVEKSPRYRK